jgi:hypothetical protein
MPGDGAQLMVFGHGIDSYYRITLTMQPQAIFMFHPVDEEFFVEWASFNVCLEIQKVPRCDNKKEFLSSDLRKLGP